MSSDPSETSRNNAIPEFKVGTDDFNIWLRKFNIYVEAKGIKEQSRKTNLLLFIGGNELMDTFFTLDVSKKDNYSYEEVVKELKKHFEPLHNKRYERYLFRQIQQDDSETMDHYITKLRKQAEKCNFHDINDSILDQVIEKCKSEEIRKDLLKKGNDLTLDQTKEIAKSYETIKLQNARLQESLGTSSSSKINEDLTSTEVLKINKQKFKNTGSSLHTFKKCFRCGGPFNKDHNCPAKTATCFKCTGSGHFANMCRSRNIKLIEVNSNNDNENNDLSYEKYLNLYVGSLETLTNNDDWIQTLIINNNKIDFKIDSGAQANVFSLNDFKQLNLDFNIISKNQKII